jgi:large subunit ribosomal protein L18
VARVEEKRLARKRRHFRVRKKIQGTAQRPRLSVYRSLRHIYAQLIDDKSGHTIVSASTQEPSFKSQHAGATMNKEAAKIVGEVLAKRALAAGLESIVFDRGGYLYHGRVKALAEGAREIGLKF